MATTATVLFNGPTTVDEAAILIASIVETRFVFTVLQNLRFYEAHVDGVHVLVKHNLHNGGDPRVYGRRWQATFRDADDGAAFACERVARRAYEALLHSRVGVTLVLDGEVERAMSASGAWRVP
jgi:hypothetical protein